MDFKGDTFQVLNIFYSLFPAVFVKVLSSSKMLVSSFVKQRVMTTLLICCKVWELPCKYITVIPTRAHPSHFSHGFFSSLTNGPTLFS